ncbi:transcription factor SAC51-like [Bidens hawaiensis]|uniref:transcription factor SAC51-like n=1 Tax=Bidens hawaiensis TaxID=980011 RepID=UPI00404AB1F3
MEKGFNSWSQDPQIDWQSLNPNLPSAQFGLGPHVMFPSFGNVVSPPVIHEPHGWFYGLPRHRQGFGFATMVNSMAKEVKETLPEASPVVARETKVGQKKFLVFDQSGDQTTLMYGFGVGPSSTRYQFPSLNKPKPQDGSHTICVDKLIEENNGNYSESEMREDTEELNALLDSDDDEDDDDDNDDDDDEDDEMSTGHSPNSMTGFQGQKQKFESGKEEEVASSGGPWKRYKKEDVGSFVNSLKDTASSLGKSGINCYANEMFEEEYDNFSSGNKKLRIEKIKETINLLQNLIPGDTSGKNAIMVIDEAIHYLTSLKVKAKALGLDSF